MAHQSAHGVCQARIGDLSGMIILYINTKSRTRSGGKSFSREECRGIVRNDPIGSDPPSAQFQFEYERALSCRQGIDLWKLPSGDEFTGKSLHHAGNQPWNEWCACGGKSDEFNAGKRRDFFIILRIRPVAQSKTQDVDVMSGFLRTEDLLVQPRIRGNRKGGDEEQRGHQSLMGFEGNISSMRTS